MEIKLKSDHLTDKAGDVIEVNKERGEYLIRMSVADEYKEIAKKAK